MATFKITDQSALCICELGVTPDGPTLTIKEGTTTASYPLTYQQAAYLAKALYASCIIDTIIQTLAHAAGITPTDLLDSIGR